MLICERLMMNIGIILTAVIILIVNVNQAIAQSNDNFRLIEANANACELNSAHVDYIRNETSESDERIFIIFRAGDGEGTKTNVRRLNIVRRFLRNNKGLGGDKVIYARGEKVKGKGRVEFYVGGELRLVTLAKRGKIPCMDCCGFDFEKGIF
jgi:hypothetical protein